MPSDTKIEELKKAFKDKKCIIEVHSNVMEIKFEKEEDADWFEDIFQYYQSESAVCCLMPIRPKGKSYYKFVFNVKDIDKFIELIKKGK
ncbi:MAG: hypothetical protein HZC47_05445 [Methanobacterium sp.]|uniref:hypothetical protein n=1 Tax=Methanobacterium sp. TaxID=2164 RepID=UPI003D660AF2|nr:hypothetical protein [Methanobacterium sp.]